MHGNDKPEAILGHCNEDVPFTLQKLGFFRVKVMKYA
jgi:hypothetical protein